MSLHIFKNAMKLTNLACYIIIERIEYSLLQEGRSHQHFLKGTTWSHPKLFAVDGTIADSDPLHFQEALIGVRRIPQRKT